MVRCAVITVSDTRGEADDTSGARIKALLAEAGHQVARYAIVKDEPDQIRTQLRDLPSDVQVVIINGGTGMARRDTTFEAVQSVFEKTIDGFGELFRMLSFQEVGAAAMFSRATAGVYHNTLIFSMPGSPNAVQVALEKLIIPEINHLAWEISRKA